MERQLDGSTQGRAHEGRLKSDLGSSKLLGDGRPHTGSLETGATITLYKITRPRY